MLGPACAGCSKPVVGWLLMFADGCWFGQLLAVDCWLLVVAGCWLLAVGCWLLLPAAGCWLMAAGCELLATDQLLAVGC